MNPFNGSETVKTIYVNQIQDHQYHGELQKTQHRWTPKLGKTGKPENGRGIGDFIGCLVHSDDPKVLNNLDMPIEIIFLINNIFMKLKKGSDNFAVNVLKCINVEGDTFKWYPRFYMWLLNDPVCGMIVNATEPEIACYKQLSNYYNNMLEGIYQPLLNLDRLKYSAIAAAKLAGRFKSGSTPSQSYLRKQAEQLMKIVSLSS